MVGSSILTFGLVATAVVANPLSYTNRNPNAYRNPYFRSLVSRDDLPAGATNNWKLDTEFKGENWYGGWTFETYPGGEPTQGRTNYVDKETAIRKGLTWTDGDKFGIAADAANKVEAGSLGRDSVRISSNKVWNNSVVVVDVLHMPEGCAVWPAFWTLGDGKEWPAAGEIDIIEGVGNDGNNQMTVHTANDAQCNLPADRAKKPGMEFWGKEHQNKCDGTAGCSILAPDTNSTFGPGLNNIGGGWYIMRRDTRGVAMWFYPRTDGDKVPDIVRNPTDDLDETALGQKIADFPSTPENKCDFNELLAAQRLIFNITFCGAWGGMKYAASACASNGKCADYVDNNPEAFKKAFWLVNSLRVYTPK